MFGEYTKYEDGLYSLILLPVSNIIYHKKIKNKNKIKVK